MIGGNSVPRYGWKLSPVEVTAVFRKLLAVVLGLACFVPLHAGEPAWKTGRVITVRVMERSEGRAAVTPPVHEDGTSPSAAARSYGASAYLALRSGAERYQAQYAGPEIETLEKLRGQTVEFRTAGGKLFLKTAAGQVLELHLLFTKMPSSKAQPPQK
jgi:hypothetical protein